MLPHSLRGHPEDAMKQGTQITGGRGIVCGSSARPIAALHRLVRSELPDQSSGDGPHQPGRKLASLLLASCSAFSSAWLKSFSTSLRLIRRRKKSAQRNSLNGVVSLANPPARRNSPASERNGSSIKSLTDLGMSLYSLRRP